jgi:hypothetical protein
MPEPTSPTGARKRLEPACMAKDRHSDSKCGPTARLRKSACWSRQTASACPDSSRYQSRTPLQEAAFRTIPVQAMACPRPAAKNLPQRRNP